uniref:Uncharacterized protein n=1 Tax=Setaria digitata TaxID=48799 RepID=A0A915PX44_9BILA
MKENWAYDDCEKSMKTGQRSGRKESQSIETTPPYLSDDSSIPISIPHSNHQQPETLRVSVVSLRTSQSTDR